MKSGDKAPEISSSQQNILSAGELMDAGRHHDRVGEYEKAIVLFDQALDTYDQDSDEKGKFEALLRLGQTYHSLGQFEHALEKSKVRKQCTTTAEAVRACVKIALASEAAKE